MKSEESKKEAPCARPSATRETGVDGAKATPDGPPGDDPGGRDNEILREFLVNSALLFEVVDRRREEAQRENAELNFDLDYEQEIADLKECNAVIRKIVATLEGLKRANNARVDDLMWYRKTLHPTPR